MYELYIRRRVEKFLDDLDPPDRERMVKVEDAARTVDIGKVDRRKERTYRDLRTLFR